MKQSINLQHVPETTLWTLHNRASEAMLDDGTIEDSKCVEIYQSIDYDYARSFGEAEPSHAVRSLTFDRQITQFLQKYPGASIVNLGEGLETQRYRIDADYDLWLSVDLPDAIETRERFIPPDEKHRHIPVSATDLSWLHQVPKDKPVFIGAQGLFMYLTSEEVETVLKSIEEYFEIAVVMFDTIPVWLSRKTLSEQGWKKTEFYTAPRMPWGINRNRLKPTICSWLGSDVRIVDSGYPLFPRGKVRWLFYFFTITPLLKNITPSIVKVVIDKSRKSNGQSY